MDMMSVIIWNPARPGVPLEVLFSMGGAGMEEVRSLVGPEIICRKRFQSLLLDGSTINGTPVYASILCTVPVTARELYDEFQSRLRACPELSEHDIISLYLLHLPADLRAYSIEFRTIALVAAGSGAVQEST